MFIMSITTFGKGSTPLLNLKFYHNPDYTTFPIRKNNTYECDHEHPYTQIAFPVEEIQSAKALHALRFIGDLSPSFENASVMAIAKSVICLPQFVALLRDIYCPASDGFVETEFKIDIGVGCKLLFQKIGTYTKYRVSVKSSKDSIEDIAALPIDKVAALTIERMVVDKWECWKGYEEATHSPIFEPSLEGTPELLGSFPDHICGE